MSLTEARKTLKELLDRGDDRVLALSGRWGTGKTHLWQQLQKECAGERIGSALFASLFSTESIADLKVKLARTLLLDEPESTWATLRQAGSRVTTFLRDAFKDYGGWFTAVDTLATLALPKLLAGHMIVLDDIERKPNSLSIDAILGFIDEFKEHHRCSFLLILNEDQFKSAVESSLWETLREKVIDHEVRLNTTPEEAFGIALGLESTEFADPIRQACMACELTNIRVVRKVIRIVNRILQEHQDLDPIVLRRVVPSTVLLAGIHYRALHDGPTIDYVLEYGGPSDDENPPPAHWDALMERLGVHSADEYERLAARFLQSGLLDAAALQAIVARYTNETETLRVNESATEFYWRRRWDRRATDHELVTEAERLVNVCHLLTPFDFTSLYRSVETLSDGRRVADQLSARWLEHFRAHPPADGFDPDDWNFWNQEVLPEIAEAVEEIKRQRHARLTVAEVCLELSENRGHSRKHEVVLRGASVGDFEDALLTFGPKELRPVLRRFDRMLTKTADKGKSEFGDAGENFLAACRNVIAGRVEGAGRLASILLDALTASGTADLLNAPANAPADDGQ